MSGCSSTCTRRPPCKNRMEMRALHGTPQEFEDSVWACEMISTDEALRGIRAYANAYLQADEGERLQEDV